LEKVGSEVMRGISPYQYGILLMLVLMIGLVVGYNFVSV